MTFCFLGCGGAITNIVRTTPDDAQRIRRACERVFPKGPFEATHVVEASIPLSDDVSLIGVAAVEADPGEFRSILMTQEGVVLFDATRRGPDIEVLRAVPPLDPKAFGRPMTDDVALILTRPAGNGVEAGRTRDGVPICRWTRGTDQVEARILGAREAQLTRLQKGEVVRRAWLREIDEQGFARDVQLETTSFVGYQLHLQLIEVHRRNGDESSAVIDHRDPKPPSLQ